MNKRTAKMIAYELAAEILWGETHQSALAWQDDRVKSDKDAYKIMDALDEIAKSLKMRHDELNSKVITL